MKKYHLSVVLTLPSQPQTEAKQADIQTWDDFLYQISSLDSLLPSYNYQISFFKEGLTPDWSQPNENQHKQGGHFNIFWSTKVQAFRSFVFLCIDLMTNKIEFAPHIDGILVGIKYSYWHVKVWVDDGFISSRVSQRYSFLLNYFQNIVGKDDHNSFKIGFQVHPTYRVYTAPHTPAIKPKTFQACINEVLGDAEEKPRLQFDLKVATQYKRSRKERRENPSYVDNIIKT